MPVSVVIASVLQFLLAATFMIMSIAVHTHGGRAQRAAEAVLARHGLPGDVLARHRIKFEETITELLFPVSIAVVMTVLGVLTLAGSGPGRIASWVAAGLMTTAGAAVMVSQMFAEKVVAAVFRRSADPAVRDLDAAAVVGAARAALPAWASAMIVIRFLLATLGSILVIVLLATPAASAYFA
ncbi:hypothetical protein SAMN05444920_101852 [Nonomuraea solani]|uniref:Uncharacterized protein n=1 Tax=Nonomuraea solani TaxID=1144553 RepID=A0A1H5VE75_9ACTN|nr:hypothetical protein [Nonomuraea solani]SEF85510.1 hypothetical protein SAMN05444920_101852 [Nonomuraea solani]